MHIKIIEEWKLELAQATSDPIVLLKKLNIDPSALQSDIKAQALFKVKVPKHYLNLIEKNNIKDPLLMQVLPNKQEYAEHPDFINDPLNEHSQSQSGFLQKYKNRALLFFNTNCAINCRYCFRRNFPYQNNKINNQDLKSIANKIAANPNINEVILSGGDPLVSDDKKIASLIKLLNENSNLDTIRIHTRMPVVIPNRLTNNLLNILADSRLQAIIVTHINHPREVSPELIQKVKIFTEKNITFLNQAVLLKGINDDI